MNTKIAQLLPRLSERSAKLRLQFCPKFDICSTVAYSEKDKIMLEQMRADTGWDSLEYSTDGPEHKAVFLMKDASAVNSNLVQVHHCATYI